MTVLLRAFQFAIDVPGRPPSYEKPHSATDVPYFEWLELNSESVYPALLLGALAVIVLGIFVAMRGDGLGLDGLQRSELKREFIRQLRANVGGLSTDALAKAVALRSGQAAILLAEMLRDNVVEQRDGLWRMKD